MPTLIARDGGLGRAFKRAVLCLGTRRNGMPPVYYRSAAKLKMPLQIGQHLVRAFEAGFEIGAKPIAAMSRILAKRRRAA